jgi:hypothetical protein
MTISFEKAPTLEDMFSRWYSISPSTVTIRRDAFLSCKGFDQRLGFGSDFFLWLRVRHKFRFIHVPETLVVYRANSPFEQLERYPSRRRSRVEQALSDSYGCQVDALIADIRDRWTQVSTECIFRQLQQRRFGSAFYLWIDLARYHPRAFMGINRSILRRGTRKTGRLIWSGLGVRAETRKLPE